MNAYHLDLPVFIIREPMTLPTDSSSDSSEDASDSTADVSKKQIWAPTPETLGMFLARLSPDQEDAGKKYETLRIKLVRFFEWRGCHQTDYCADKTIDRVMQKMDEGQVISNFIGFVFGVARIVAKETWREQDHERPLDDSVSPPVTERVTVEPEEAERRQDCFDRCIEALPADGRNLIISYYQDQGRKKIDRRRELARKLGIPLNALRIRAHRIRKTLEECIQNCLAQRA